MSFKAEESTIDRLFNNSIYRIPRNQRKYVWTDKNWEELFDDIIIITENKIKIKTQHFIGSIVLHKEEKIEGLESYTIIDGQQRIITLSLFLSSVMILFFENKMAKDFNGTIKYIISKNLINEDVLIIDTEYHISLKPILKSVIELINTQSENFSINNFINNNLISKQDKKLGNCLKFFYDKTKDYINSNKNDKEKLLKIRNSILNINYVQIICTSEEDSYTIFEILNARGQELKDHELLKNYTMRYLNSERMKDEPKAIWGEIEKTLGKYITKFFKHYATHKFGNNKDEKISPYKSIQRATKGSNIDKLLYDINKKTDYYTKFVNPKFDDDNPNCSELEYSVFNFFKKRKQEQFRPVLLSLISQKIKGNINEKDYNSILLFLYNFFICFNIIGQENSNKLEDPVYKYSELIENQFSEKYLLQFLNNLKSKIPSQKWFANAFKNVGYSRKCKLYNDEKNKDRVQIVLNVLENYINKNMIDSRIEFSIEHLIPDSEKEETAQIGNLILLEKSLNEKCDNKQLIDKFNIYETSNFKMPKNIANEYKNKVFNPNQRTEYLADFFYNKILKFDKFTSTENIEKQLALSFDKE